MVLEAFIPMTKSAKERGRAAYTFTPLSLYRNAIERFNSPYLREDAEGAADVFKIWKTCMAFAEN